MPSVADEDAVQRFLSLDRQLPYLMAASYTVIVSVLVIWIFPVPPPRFMDLYLIGIVFLSARWSAGPAILIYALSLLFCGWILPPSGSLAVSEGYDIYRLCSYSATSLAVIWGIDHVRSRR